MQHFTEHLLFVPCASRCISPFHIVCLLLFFLCVSPHFSPSCAYLPTPPPSCAFPMCIPVCSTPAIPLCFSPMCISPVRRLHSYFLLSSHLFTHSLSRTSYLDYLKRIPPCFNSEVMVTGETNLLYLYNKYCYF